MMRRSVLMLAMLPALAACGTGASATSPIASSVDPCAPTSGLAVSASVNAGVSRWAVRPTSTDKCITTNLDSHFVYRVPGRAPTGRLFVFLPGTGAIAQFYTQIVSQAAQAGYHAVGLTYPNDQAIAVLCAAQATACHGTARLEVLTGQPVSSVLAVTRVNSIENRLVALLKFMSVIEPAGNWGQFVLGDTAVDWTKVSIAGHSQGGGHALFIAQRYGVWRATAYASAGDVLPGGGPAAWMSLPFATTADRIFGFISTNDELIAASATLTTWGTALGLNSFGAAASVDGASPPFGHTHRLTTSAIPAHPGVGIGPNHNMVVVDVNTPKVGASTVPVFAPVWRYLSFP